MSINCLAQDREDLLWLLNYTFLILTLSARPDILEVLANVLRKMKCTWILPLQDGKQLTKHCRIIIWPWIAQGVASVAKPVVRKLTLIQRRVNTSEMEGPCAAITAYKVAVAST